MQVNDSLVTKELTIAINTATSGYLDIRGAKRIRIKVPSAWDAADITFMVKEALTDKPTLRVTIAAAKLRKVSGTTLARISGVQTAEAGWYDVPDDLVGCPYFAIRSTNTASEADLNQTAARTLLVAITL